MAFDSPVRLSAFDGALLLDLANHSGEWLRLMDLNPGIKSSKKHASMMKLLSGNLAERKRRNTYRTRPSFVYRITPEGRELIDAIRSSSPPLRDAPASHS